MGLGYCETNHIKNKYGIFQSKWKRNQYNENLHNSCLFQISTILSVLTVSLIPFLTLVILNYLIFRTIQKKTFIISNSAKSVRRELHIATILISIVTLFIICHILKFVINMLELVSVLIGEQNHINTKRSFFKLYLKLHLFTRLQAF